MVGAVGWQSDCLANLAVLLDAPMDPNRVGNIRRRIFDYFQLAFRFVEENKVFGGKCLFYLVAQWLHMVIDLQLVGLCIFTNSVANVSTKGDYIKKEATIQVWVVGFVAPILNNARLYKTGPDKYLEPG